MAGQGRAHQGSQVQGTSGRYKAGGLAVQDRSEQGDAQHIRAARGSAGTNLAAGVARGSTRQAGQRQTQQLAPDSMSEHSRTQFEQSRPKQAQQMNPGCPAVVPCCAELVHVVVCCMQALHESLVEVADGELCISTHSSSP
jgi:hypothetical protein